MFTSAPPLLVPPRPPPGAGAGGERVSPNRALREGRRGASKSKRQACNRQWRVRLNRTAVFTHLRPFPKRQLVNACTQTPKRTLNLQTTQPPKPLLLSCLLTRHQARNLTKKRGRPQILQQFPAAFTPKSPSSGLQKLATGSSFLGRFSTPSHSPSPFCPTSGDHSLLSLGSALPCPVNLLPLYRSS